MNNRELLAGLLSGDPAVTEMMTGPASGPAQSAAVDYVPSDGTLPDDVLTVINSHVTTLGQLKARNAGKGLWALFTPAYKEVPYAVFDGVNRLEPDAWPQTDHWAGALAPLELAKDSPFNFAMTANAVQQRTYREGWVLPGFAWASR